MVQYASQEANVETNEDNQFINPQKMKKLIKQSILCKN